MTWTIWAKAQEEENIEAELQFPPWQELRVQKIRVLQYWCCVFIPFFLLFFFANIWSWSFAARPQRLNISKSIPTLTCSRPLLVRSVHGKSGLQESQGLRHQNWQVDIVAVDGSRTTFGKCITCAGTFACSNKRHRNGEGALPSQQHTWNYFGDYEPV